MKFLKKLDKVVDFVVGNVAAIMLIFLILFTCVTIISRYLFNINMHGYEELPTMKKKPQHSARKPMNCGRSH